MEKGKIKMSDVREIAINYTAIPLYKAMGFKIDSKINRQAAEALSLINYNIGDELKEIEPEFNLKVSAIRSSIFTPDVDIDSLDEVTRKTLIRKLNKAIYENDELTEINKKLDELWSREIENDLETIEIEEKDYSEKFKDENKTVMVLNREYSVDGYSALLAMITKNFIVIK